MYLVCKILIDILIPYSGKFLRRIIFAVFTDRPPSAKIVLHKKFPFGNTVLPLRLHSKYPGIHGSHVNTEGLHERVN